MTKKITILAIDDEQDILYTLAAIGTAVGWKVHTENNSLAAADKVAELRPNLILLDYHMPQQNGVVTGTESYARLFNADGSVSGVSSLGDLLVGFSARNPQVAADDRGEFIVV